MLLFRSTAFFGRGIGNNISGRFFNRRSSYFQNISGRFFNRMQQLLPKLFLASAALWLRFFYFGSILFAQLLLTAIFERLDTVLIFALCRR
ncbi:MAG: hypothetical protein IPL35_15995 [Sphingobacteriales bacterium]|nr:hypothetical protein [Sphingobacteriales bacterium]